MNINKTEELIKIEKNKFLEENNSVDRLLELFNPDNHPEYINYYVFIIATFLFAFSGYSLTLSSFHLSQFVANTVGSLAAAICLILSLSFSLMFILCSSCGFFIFCNGMFLKEKLNKAKNNPEEYNKMVEYLTKPAFNKQYITEDILNQLKIGLSTEDYQSIRLANKQGITYEVLYSLLETEKEKEKIREEQRNVIFNDNNL